MENRYILAFLVISLAVFLSSCVSQVSEPMSPGTADIESAMPSEQSNETQSDLAEDKQETAPASSAEVIALLGKAESKVKSIRYKYKGPETKDMFYDFFVKVPKIKYIPDREIKSYINPEDYDTIFLDTSKKTAASYCIDKQCISVGKKADIEYNDYYIKTPLDWLGEIQLAEKLSEEMLQNRNVWKLQTNFGLAWIDTYYGVPLQVENNGSRYIFSSVAYNTVLDSDVVLPQE